MNLPDAQAKCYIYINKFKIAAAILTDDQYPENAAFMIINQIHKEFAAAFEVEKYATVESTPVFNVSRHDRGVSQAG